jgi:hypothetical protein
MHYISQYLLNAGTKFNNILTHNKHSSTTNFQLLHSIKKTCIVHCRLKNVRGVFFIFPQLPHELGYQITHWKRRMQHYFTESLWENRRYYTNYFEFRNTMQPQELPCCCKTQMSQYLSRNTIICLVNCQTISYGIALKFTHLHFTYKGLTWKKIRYFSGQCLFPTLLHFLWSYLRKTGRC